MIIYVTHSLKNKRNYAKYYDVPTDYLLGFTESRITKNLEIKQLHLTDKAIEVLMSGKQNNSLLSDIIEHTEFSNLINSIDVYVRQLAAPHINTVNNMLKIAQHGIDNYYSDNKPKPEDFNSAMNYMNETVINEDDFLRFRISERFNQILRDVYNDYAKDNDKPQNTTNEVTGHMVDVLNMVKSGELKLDTPEDAVAIMMERMGASQTDMLSLFDELFGGDD